MRATQNKIRRSLWEAARRLGLKKLDQDETNSLVDYVMHALSAPPEYEDTLRELSVQDLLEEALSVRGALDDLVAEDQTLDDS